MARKPYRPAIGSISHGTMRSEDIIGAITWELRNARLTKAQRNVVREAEAARENCDEDNDTDHAELLSDLCDELFDIMDELAPPYVYFGTTEGDGSDFGFWPCLDQIEEDRRNGDLPNVDDVPKGYSGLAIEVNDHGNVTLYRYTRGKRAIVWDCV